MADSSALPAPRPEPLDPAVLRVIEALARWQAQRDYDAAQQRKDAK